MPSAYLTKSGFKACLHCRTKLYYRKNRYPSNLDENEYLKFLADGRFMVEFIAKTQFQDGVDLVDERDPLSAFAWTKALLAAGDVTLSQYRSVVAWAVTLISPPCFFTVFLSRNCIWGCHQV
jgi:hypothetical protein